ncbi:NADH-quinone oxidoreductase subunit N [Thalassotalea castellviae]|uniref:NADH-quinone oxidoreductase subunit N n=1 Tax=Thalassotalea castellviae TaxID=3075612 RepID=A0ABU2ZXR8_9GAMM|nr:NADH-quinone oxidoreductase subunit N [Thalassotalea sp. W431]MDT0602726.1 NADH-quinone oxidoreductase subunit N [Thalassotalea sp. W431]
MDLFALSMIVPQLIIAAGIVLAMLLVAWRRSQQLIANFTLFTLILSLVATIHGFGFDKISVTMLLAVDDYSRFAFILVLSASIVCLYLSKIMLKQVEDVHDEYYLLLLLVVLGAGILVVSDHFASLFLGFELLSIAIVGLVGYCRKAPNAVETGFKYLILSASASSFMLLGIAFMYAQTGDLSFTQTGLENVTLLKISLLYQIGFMLFFSGVAFKLSLVPFHFWTPDVYQGASSPVAMLLATVSKCAMFIVLLKCCYTATNLMLLQNDKLFEFIAWIAILSMIVGNSLALKQQSIKRLLAYSSIAHMGYLLIVLLISDSKGLNMAWQSVLFYLTAYLLANASIFTVITLMNRDSEVYQDITINDWRGLFWQQPLRATLLIFSLLSFAGIPLTAGFIGKFYLITLAANQALWALLAALIIGSGIALAYYLPVIFSLFSLEKPRDDLPPASMSILEKCAVILLIFTGLAIGIFPNAIGRVLQAI